MKIAALSLILLIVGCHSVENRSYDVNVKNDSIKPVTIWLTKNGPPWEAGWKSPEDLAIESPKNDERIAGVVVPPGKTASTGKIAGQFEPHVDAILRVYLGQKTFDDLLAVSHDSPDRIEVVLKPGVNQIVVRDDNGSIKATRIGP